MTRDIETLNMWTTICLIVAALATTSFPLLYLFSPWYKTRFGRAVMAQSTAFAVALDLTLMFHIWTPSDPLVRFWIVAAAFTFVAVTTSGLTLLLWEFNYRQRQDKKEAEENDDNPSTCG